MKQLTELNAWNALKDHASTTQFTTLSELHQADPMRQQKLTFSANNISIDISNQRIDNTTIALLLALAQERQLHIKISDLMQGKKVNISENRPALHTALRTQTNSPILVDGHDIIPGILQTREKIREISQTIRTRKHLGHTGKPITDIVNIGIGGSDLGPKFCINALKEFTDKTLSYHFVSDVDPNAFSSAVENRDLSVGLR